ncbi:HEPN domain-containing protein [Rhizobacter fulvus]
MVDNDDIERRLNDFARRSFRDMADRDYLAARLAHAADLMPQFMWSSQQALEKYLKYILLVNRIRASKVRHDIIAALALTAQLPFAVQLSDRSREFIDHVGKYGEHRYLDVSSHAIGHVLIDLDLAVWELRRYCQVLVVTDKTLNRVEQRILDTAVVELELSHSRPRHTFRLSGGYLESVLDNPNHPAREALVRQNPCYGVRARKSVRSRHVMQAFNAPLYLFPEMLDELVKYVYVPNEKGWREYRDAIRADPSKRP